MTIAFLLTLHVILALIVSVHILLSKKQVGGAIGWLGITWFSPVVGSLFYFIFGINRVARKALRIRQLAGSGPRELGQFRSGGATRSPDSKPEPIRSVGDLLSDFAVAEENDMEIYQNGDEAYPEMLAAIAAAEKSVALSSYIFRMDENGREFVDALTDARQRGVEIKVLIDGVGGGFLWCPVVSELASRGIDARRFLFSLLPWEMSYLNLRNHKKLLILDGETAFVGGMNIGSENLIRRKRPGAVRDTHFRFGGGVVRQLLLSFAEDWYFTTDEELSGDNWWPELKKSGTVSARVINSGPDQEPGNVETLFGTAIACAQKRISIVTPYFLPDERIRYLLDLAALRGVEVNMVVPRKTDFRFFDWAMEAQLATMALDRINCRCSPQPFDHSKLVTVDGKWCAVGSPNWDARSMRLNFEILVECHDAQTVERIDAIISRKLRESTPYEKKPANWTTLFPRLRNASARLLMPYL